jgi:hypothetical protein
MSFCYDTSPMSKRINPSGGPTTCQSDTSSRSLAISNLCVIASPSHLEELSIRRIASQNIVFALADPGNHIPAPIRPLHSPVVNHMQYLGPEPQLDPER